MRSLVVTALVCVSCGRQAEPPKPEGVTEWTSEFYGMFEGCSMDTTPIPVQHVRVASTEVALCTIHTIREPGAPRALIQINQSVWERLSLSQQKAVVWHELAHCALEFRGHIDSEHSYMNAMLVASNFQVAEQNFVQEMTDFCSK